MAQARPYRLPAEPTTRRVRWFTAPEHEGFELSAEPPKIGAPLLPGFGQAQAPTLVLQGLTDRIVRPRDTRVLTTRLGGAVELQELPAGHLLLDPTTPTWPR